jgi:hypothetical protein
MRSSNLRRERGARSTGCRTGSTGSCDIAQRVSAVRERVARRRTLAQGVCLPAMLGCTGSSRRDSLQRPLQSAGEMRRSGKRLGADSGSVGTRRSQSNPDRRAFKKALRAKSRLHCPPPRRRRDRGTFKEGSCQYVELQPLSRDDVRRLMEVRLVRVQPTCPAPAMIEASQSTRSSTPTWPFVQSLMVPRWRAQEREHH